MVPSPCINVCRMEAGVCAGCHRTLDEIARWGNASDSDKRRILAAIAQRQPNWRASDPGIRGR